MKKNVLVVPCGTEIGLEIADALKSHKHYNVYGANSIQDYSHHIYKNIIENMPFINHKGFIDFIQNIVKEKKIDFIIPAHDDATILLKENEDIIGCKVICSDIDVTKTVRSKKKTYHALDQHIRVPKLYHKNNIKYPSFVKPDIGQGSKGAYKIIDDKDINHINDKDIICEYLPGDEFTVDCLSDRNKNLIYCSPRVRTRIRNGIAVGTQSVQDQKKEFFLFAEKISKALKIKGAWFFQVKRDVNGYLCLLEVAVRISGSMALSRAKGVNFVELSLLIHQDYDVSVIIQDFHLSMERSLNRCFTTDISYETLYIDFDDCIVLKNGQLNIEAINLIIHAHNNNKKVILISRHKGDLKQYLQKLRISALFDDVIHIKDKTPKSHFIRDKYAVFVDDAFTERLDVSKNCLIPVFSIDSMTVLYR